MADVFDILKIQSTTITNLIHDIIRFRVDIEVVVRENDGSRMLGANEAIDVINQDKVKDKLSSQNFKVSKVTKGEIR